MLKAFKELGVWGHEPPVSLLGSALTLFLLKKKKDQISTRKMPLKGSYPLGRQFSSKDSSEGELNGYEHMYPQE